MRKLIVTEYLSADGVMESPEDWAFQYHGHDMLELSQDGMQSSDALLLGRVTYQIFSAYWPTATDEPYASHMRNVNKYVASTTLTEAPWGADDSATIVSDLAGDITKLKQQDGKNIGVIGSAGLVQSLTSANLVDEYHLFIHPLILGSGKRLFDEDNSARLELVDTQRVDSGIVLLKYQLAGLG